MDIITKDWRTGSLVRVKEIIKRTGLSSATIYRREAAGPFRRKHSLGARCVTRYLSDIDDVVAQPASYWPD